MAYGCRRWIVWPVQPCSASAGRRQPRAAFNAARVASAACRAAAAKPSSALAYRIAREEFTTIGPSGRSPARTVAAASPPDVTLVEATLAERVVAARPERLSGDNAYDRDPLDVRLAAQGIELIAPHRAKRTNPKTQDGRPLRRSRPRWKVEGLCAWLQNFRRVLVRHAYDAATYLGVVQLGCTVIFWPWYL